MIEAFLFDMGNVLIHFSHERMCRQMAQECGMTAEKVRTLLFDSAVQAEIECGRLSEQELHARLESLAGRPIAIERLVHAASDIFEANEAIESVIAELRGQGRRLVLLSNTGVSHFRFVRSRFPILDLFDAFVLSYEVGAMKPDRAIFEAAVAAAGCPAERCFYTDDIASYVAAGREFGLQASLYTDVPALVGQLRALGIDVPAPN